MKTIALLLVGAFPVVCFAQSESVADLLAKGALANSESKWDAATEAYAKARAVAVGAGDVKSEALALAGMAGADYGRSRYDAAEKLAEQSLEIAQRIGDRGSTAAALNQIANVQYRRGQFVENRQTLLRMLAIEEELGDRNGIGIVLNNLGNALRQLGDKLQAIEYLTRAAAAFAELGKDRSRAVALNNIGIGYGELGDYERGLDFSRQSLALAETLKDDSRAGNALNNIAVIETYRGNYREALQLYQKALEADRRAASPWAVVEATNNIGLVYHAQQNHEQAIAYFNRTIELNRAVGDQTLDADAHRNLGGEMLALNRLPEAVTQLRESLNLAEKTSFRSGEAQAHLGLGSVLIRLNQLAEAEAELRSAAEIQREISDAASLAQTASQFSRLRLKQGRSEEALEEARLSIQLLSSIDRPETLWQAELAAGRALKSLGRSTEAGEHFQASVAAIESLRTHVAGPPTALPVYFVNKLEPYQELVAIALAARKTDDALRMVEQSKSRALGDILRSGRIDLEKSLTREERETERRLQNRLAGFHLQISRQPGDPQLKVGRNRARQELDALQSDLYASHPETAFERGALPPLSAAEMQQLAADTGAAILDYYVAPQNSYLFVIRRGAATRVFPIGAGEAALTAKAEEFRRQLASHDLGYAASARELYDLLLAPAARDLEREAGVVIIPDGPLWNVAFQALQPVPHHFLIETTVVSYAPSLTVLRETLRLTRERRAKPATRELLALGNPAGQVSLPESERQVRELEKLYGAAQSRILTGEDATQTRLRAEAGNYRVLHIASHAILDGSNPMYSQVLLARSENDPGTLEARDLMQYNVKAELLVLSACETARGRAAAGEGINGMLWAAFVAGAPTAVASLWRVEAASTSELMIDFHRRWLEARRSRGPLSKASAMQKAALSLIAGGKYAHPFYWAGFILVGSPI